MARAKAETAKTIKTRAAFTAFLVGRRARLLLGYPTKTAVDAEICRVSQRSVKSRSVKSRSVKSMQRDPQKHKKSSGTNGRPSPYCWVVGLCSDDGVRLSGV